MLSGRLKKGVVSFVIAVFGVVSLLSVPVAAQESTTASGLRVAPLRTELIISPGKSDVVSVKVKNVTGGTVSIRSIVVDFRPKEDGSPDALAQSEERLPTSIQSFVTPEDNVVLERDQEHDYELPVIIPSDTAPGAYYGLILFQAIPSDQTSDTPGQVSLTASVGHIVLIEVPGNIVQQMQVSSVRAARLTEAKDGTAPSVKTGSLFANGPNQVRVSVKNTGNGFLKPFGNVTIQDWRGKEVASTEINATDPKGNVFPGAERTFTASIDEVKGIGRFTILASIGYGNGNEVVTVKSSFWVLPIWFVIVVAVLLIAVVYIILRVVNRFRKK